ncbi:MAG: transcriptional regulator [Cyanobacteria bacterium J06627_8]
MDKSNDYNGAMHPHFEHNHRQKQSNSQNSDTLDSLKRDRWELLNAYLDSEVTPKEKRMVERWLKEDQKIQCLYARLLQLRCSFQAVPVPPSGASVEEVVQGVCRRIDRQRIRRNIMLGGAALAALLGALVTSNVNLRQLPSQSIDGSELNPDGLELQLDQPLLPASDEGEASIPLEKLVAPTEEPLFDKNEPSSD